MEQTACKCTPGEFQAIPAQSMSCKQRLHGMHAFPTTWRPQAAQNDKGSVQDSHQFVTGTGVRAPAARLAVQHDAVLGRAADDAHALARGVELQDVEHLVRRVGAALAHAHRRAGARMEDETKRARGRDQRGLVRRLCLVRHALRVLGACARCDQRMPSLRCMFPRVHVSVSKYMFNAAVQLVAPEKSGLRAHSLGECARTRWQKALMLGGTELPTHARHMTLRRDGAPRCLRRAPRACHTAARRAVRNDRVADRERAEELAQQLRPRLAPPGAAHQPRVAEIEALGRVWAWPGRRRRPRVPGGARRASAGRSAGAGLRARARGGGGWGARRRGRAARAAGGRALRLSRALAVGHAADAALQPAQRAQLGRTRDGLWTEGAPCGALPSAWHSCDCG